MKTSGLKSAARDLRTLYEDGAVGSLTDAELLGRFVARKDEAAFGAIVDRHGPLVWGVCRRVLGHHDAEDAFQAAFLVLARKAASVSPREMLPNWLHGVAYRTAVKARATAARRHGREKPVAELPEPEVAVREPGEEWLPLLDRELHHLPEKYRAPIVFCDLEGLTHQEAARRLDCPIGTLSARLSRGRALLARRLSRQGVALSGGALGTLLAREASSAGLPAALAALTARVAGPGPAPAEVVALADGVLKAMLIGKLKLATAILASLAALVTGTALLAQSPGGRTSSAAQGGQAVSKPEDKPARPADEEKKRGPILKGRIVDEAGRPLAGVKVQLYSGFATRLRGQEATTDERGEYRFDPLKTGGMTRERKGDRWDLYVGMQVSHPTHVSADGHSWWDETVPGIDRHEHVKDFSMVPGGRLEGRLHSAETKKPLARVDLRILSPSPRSVKFSTYATTDDEGRFTVPVLFPGEYVIDVNSSKLNYPMLGQVKIEAGKANQADLAVQGALGPAIALDAWVHRVRNAHDTWNLARLRAFTETVREVEDTGRTTTTKHFFQQPDQYRCEIQSPGEARTLVCILTPKRLRRWWRYADGRTEEVFLNGIDMTTDGWRDTVKFLGPKSVLRLDDPEHALTLLDDARVGDRPAAVIRVVKETPSPKVGTKLFFDKENGLLVKEESVLQGSETLYRDYETIDKLPIARKMTRKATPGKLTTEIEVVEFKVQDKLDAELFQKP